MKQIIIGDIHGRTIWKDIVNQEFDRVIFIGDYVDTHEDINGSQQLENLLNVIEFKKQNQDKVILLVGNHDYQYWPGSPDRGQYSGYQVRMAPSFEAVFDQNKKLFQMCFEDEFKTIYSHAGLTKTFIENKIGHLDTNHINDVFRYSPKSFCFYMGDHSGSGDNINQSCIWVRPNSLYRDGIDRLQVVGHTSVNSIGHPPKNERRGFYDVDCLPKEYLVRVDEEFEIAKCK